MSKSRGAYRPEFLVRAGRTPAELAGEFDPTAQSIRNWVSQSERNASRGTTQSRPNCSPIPRRSPKLDFIENLARSAAEVAVKDWFGAEHFIGPLEGEPELSEVTERAPTAPHVGPVEQLEAI